MSNNFEKAVEARRSIYAISKNVKATKAEIENAVKSMLKNVPSAFNSQSARLVVLFGDDHDKLWDIVLGELKKLVPAESFAPTAEKIAGFKAGFGTVLFYEDQAVIEGLQKAFSGYADNFPLWSLQSSGMLQFAVWTLLEDLGLGGSLQHYNPLIDAEVAKAWNIPESYKLWAQLVFGNPEAEPGAKEFNPLEDRIKIYG